VESQHYDDLDVGERVILRWILERMGDMDWIDLAEGKGSVEGSCEYGNECSSSLKFWGILE
jgi:hypothetical protein